MTTAVAFRGVTRRFGEVRAVDGVSFEIADGEFFAMLGPSGSGKTTCLRLIAGFEEPDAGEIALHGQSMRGVPPYDRPVNTVFQDYALFPHMHVLDNVAYGLMVRGVARAERYAKAEAMLELVALAGLGGRRPAQLSGGQRQRVALARALVLRPEVLLLDEPLGALDLKLRQQMQGELKALQRQVGITFVFVTHDQDEALGMADRVAVFNQGRIEQIGTAEEVYEHPATAFVAGFVGSSNIVDVAAARHLFGQAQAFALRPERIGVDQAAEITVEGTVVATQYHGASTRLDVALDGGPVLVVDRANDGRQRRHVPGERVRLGWPAAAMRPLREP
jgi:putative spermidine/putrescine transport system ATP-binding protein